MFPAGMLSIIWHHGEKHSQEPRVALDAPHPEVTLSCFYALRGQSTVLERRKAEREGGRKGGNEGGRENPRRYQKSKAGPLRKRWPGMVYIQKW